MTSIAKHITTTSAINLTTQKDGCDTVDENSNKAVLYMTPIALLFLVLLSFLEKRKYLSPWCCNSRPGLVVAIDFIHTDRRLWATGAVFGLLSYGILNLFGEAYIIDAPAFDDPDFTEKFGWARVFLVMLNVSILCTVHYPLLACLTLRRHLAANVAGLVYLTPWVVFRILSTLACPPIRPTPDYDIDEAKEEVRRWMGVSYMVGDVPTYICYTLLYTAYIMDLVNNSRTLCCNYQVDTLKLTKSYRYVQQLYIRPPDNNSKRKLKKWITKLTYSDILGFRYSPRVICAMICSLFVIYKACTQLDIAMTGIVSMVRTFLLSPDVGLFPDNETQVRDFLVESLDIASIELKVCNYVSAFIHLIFMVDTILKFRSHMRKLFRGDHSWHHEFDESPATCMVYGTRYGGYQIAYMLYGWIILTTVSFIFVYLFTYLVAIPIRDGYSTVAISLIRNGWPAIVISFAIYHAQRLSCKYMFLQKKGKHLAIDNRRVFNILDFYFFFYNVVLGLFSCLRRVLYSLVLGTFMISRLDRCLLMRGFETFDPGVQAYLGMILLDVQNTHPVMKVFIQLLEASRQQIDSHRTPEKIKSRKYRNKWYRAYTLARNPTIVLERLQKELKENVIGNVGTMGDVVDSAMTVFNGRAGMILGQPVNGVKVGMATEMEMTSDIGRETSTVADMAPGGGTVGLDIISHINTIDTSTILVFRV